MPLLLRRKLSLAGAGVAVAGLALYPVLVYFGLQNFSVSSVAAALIVICALRLLTARASRRAVGRPGPSSPPLPMITSVACIGLAVISLAQGRSAAMLYYPVLVNAVLFLLFAHSLVSPPSVIERLARLKDVELPERAVIYTRRATVAWAVFFACNGGAALYTTVAASREAWMLYNGFIAYVLIGAMFGGEFLVRSKAMRRSEP